jgi:hypothetical protein
MHVTTIAAQICVIPPQLAMFFGHTCLVAFAPLLTQFMTILIPFARVAVRLAMVLTEIAPVVVQVLFVPAYVGVRRRRILIGGIYGRHRGQREDSTENYQTRFTHETFSPDDWLLMDENIFGFRFFPMKVRFFTIGLPSNPPTM